MESGRTMAHSPDHLRLILLPHVTSLPYVNMKFHAETMVGTDRAILNHQPCQEWSNFMAQRQAEQAQFAGSVAVHERNPPCFCHSEGLRKALFGEHRMSGHKKRCFLS